MFHCADADAFVSRNLTLYLDGTEIEQREIARKGYLEITIPAGALQESLKVAPGKGSTIRRVLTAPQQPPKNIEKELTQLAEREELLHSRLKALSVREEIFKSAAKSQSAKAPRRTKTNPEPLSSIKQGTDYAISQLETVYQAKRKTEKELAQIAERRSRLDSQELSGGTVARVWLTPPSGEATFSWREPGRSWTPVYQLRVEADGSAAVSLMTQAVSLAKGESAVLVLAPLQNSGNNIKFRYENEWSTLKKAGFKVTNPAEANPAPYSVTFPNSSALDFPPGEISCFKSGVYVGKGKFPGVDSGKAAEIVCSER
jgi:hypothetical protein